MREQLAKSHSRGKISDSVMAAGMAGISSQLGILILRYVDNGDMPSFLAAKGILAKKLAGNGSRQHSGAANAVARVLVHFRDQRCQTCLGRGTVPQATGVVMPCPAKCAHGLVSRLNGWTDQHERVARMIREEIDRSMERIRAVMA